MLIRTYKDNAGRWRWTMHDDQGRAVEQGEAHGRREDADAAVRARIAQIEQDRNNRAAAKRRATLAKKKATGRGRR